MAKVTLTLEDTETNTVAMTWDSDPKMAEGETITTAQALGTALFDHALDLTNLKQDED